MLAPLFPQATPSEARAILGAMRAVAQSGRGWQAADALALSSAARYLFGYAGPLDPVAIPVLEPDALRAALENGAMADDAIRFLAVMAMVDPPIDPGKFRKVLDYARAFGMHERYLDEIAAAASGRVNEALADMTRANMTSILNAPWADADVMAWMYPYQGAGSDPALNARFEVLGTLDPATFGRAYFEHFKRNRYAFPGDPKGLNAKFCVPHDSTHVLSGYDTTPRGEILVSTFTASMHRRYPMAGHVLPVIFSWHFRVRINDVAGDAAGALDASEVWRAWAAGAEAAVDTFAPAWAFWDHIERPLEDLRAQWRIPAGGVQADRSTP